MATSFGRHRRLSQWLAAVLLVAGWLVPLAVPHTAADDVLCVAGEGPAGAATARITVADAEHQPGHCVICHAIRSFRTTLADSGPATVSLTAEPAVEALLGSWHRAPAFDKLPARAPPA